MLGDVRSRNILGYGRVEQPRAVHVDGQPMTIGDGADATAIAYVKAVIDGQPPASATYGISMDPNTTIASLNATLSALNRLVERTA